LTVGTDESAAKITIKAEAESGKYGTAIVYIKDNGGAPPEEEGPYPSNLGLSIEPIEITLDKGSANQQFTAKYKSNDDEAVSDAEWTLNGSKDKGTKLIGSALSIGAGETAEKIVVKADKKDMESAKTYSGEAVVRVRGNETEPPVVNNGIKIEPQTISVARGGKKQFKATDNIAGEEPAVTWRIEGGVSGTTVSDGELTVSNTETAAYLTLRAETADGSYGTAWIKVTAAAAPAGNPAIAINLTEAHVRAGGTQRFTAVIDNMDDTSVQWFVSGGVAGGSSSITADDDGDSAVLAVGAGETADTLTVKAVSTANAGLFATATVYVQRVVSVTVTLPSTSVQKGETVKFITNVEVKNDAAKTVTWSITATNLSNLTVINSKSGELSIDINETATSIKVMATSTVSPNVSGTVQVTVTSPPVKLVKDSTYTGTWEALLIEVRNTCETGGTANGKTVALDISATTLATTSGLFEPRKASAANNGSNDYNTGEKYIAELVLPDAATRIANGASGKDVFYGFRPNLTKVSARNVTSIGNYAFSGCGNLAKADFPKATSINSYAFAFTSLTSLSLPATPPVLAKGDVFRDTRGGTLYIRVPAGAVTAYTSQWGVAADTAASGKSGVYGSGHSRIIITDQ
jgi:hypothetical protein